MKRIFTLPTAALANSESIKPGRQLRAWRICSGRDAWRAGHPFSDCFPTKHRVSRISTPSRGPLNNPKVAPLTDAEQMLTPNESFPESQGKPSPLALSLRAMYENRLESAQISLSTASHVFGESGGPQHGAVNASVDPIHCLLGDRHDLVTLSRTCAPLDTEGLTPGAGLIQEFGGTTYRESL